MTGREHCAAYCAMGGIAGLSADTCSNVDGPRGLENSLQMRKQAQREESAHQSIPGSQD